MGLHPAAAFTEIAVDGLRRSVPRRKALVLVLCCLVLGSTIVLAAHEVGNVASAGQSLPEPRSFFTSRHEYKRLAGTIRLSEEGEARYVIVAPEDSPTPVRFAAEELKFYLDRITGAEFLVVSEAPQGSGRIVLGNSPASRAAGIDVTTIKRDGYTIIVRPGEIIIAGEDDAGEKSRVLLEVKGALVAELWGEPGAAGGISAGRE